MSSLITTVRHLRKPAQNSDKWRTPLGDEWQPAPKIYHFYTVSSKVTTEKKLLMQETADAAFAVTLEARL